MSNKPNEEIINLILLQLALESNNTKMLEYIDDSVAGIDTYTKSEIDTKIANAKQEIIAQLTQEISTQINNVEQELKDYIDSALEEQNTIEPNIKSATLTAGNTSVTFTDIPTTGNYLINIYTDTLGLEYINVDNSTTGTLVYTFEAQESDVTVYLTIKEVK